MLMAAWFDGAMGKRSGRTRAITAALRRWLRKAGERPPLGPPRTLAPRLECVECGQALAPVLADLGSLTCHECRRPAGSVTIGS